jgi:hypothetical protein
MLPIVASSPFNIVFHRPLSERERERETLDFCLFLFSGMCQVSVVTAPGVTSNMTTSVVVYSKTDKKMNK